MTKVSFSCQIKCRYIHEPQFNFSIKTFQVLSRLLVHSQANSSGMLFNRKFVRANGGTTRRQFLWLIFTEYFRLIKLLLLLLNDTAAFTCCLGKFGLVFSCLHAPKKVDVTFVASRQFVMGRRILTNGFLNERKLLSYLGKFTCQDNLEAETRTIS